MLGRTEGKARIGMGLLKRHGCDMCGLRFSRQEELMQHKQAVHFGNSPYDCRECGMDFASMEEMRTHLQREHSYKRGSARRP